VDLVVPEAKCPPVEPFERSFTSLIIFQVIGMLAAVRFDDDLCLWAGEVGNVPSQPHLPPELETLAPSAAQMRPEDFLLRRHFAS
jgi:hypothetical protein